MKYKLKSIDIWDLKKDKLVFRLYFEKIFQNIETLEKFCIENSKWAKAQGYESYANYIQFDYVNN